jgi:AcrR family transcriptional regulator
MGKGHETRERIMEIAQGAILDKGFGATSIEEIIAEAGITKSGFFYHFKDKNELARALLRRYIDRNEEILDDIFVRARELSEDPLQAFLIGLKLFAETLADVQAKHPGCLIASMCYQERLFDRQVFALLEEGAMLWSVRFRAYIDEIQAVHPLVGVEPDDLAEALTCVVDGAIVMAKITGDPRRLERQVMTYRAFVKMAFSQPAIVRRPLTDFRAAAA